MKPVNWKRIAQEYHASFIRQQKHSSNEEGNAASRIWFQGAENRYARAIKRDRLASLSPDAPKGEGK